MDDLEQQLKSALQRMDPSAGFEAKVLKAAVAKNGARWFGLRFSAAAAIAAMLIGGVVWREGQERQEARGEEAKARLMLALKVTGTKLQEIQQKVDHTQ